MSMEWMDGFDAEVPIALYWDAGSNSVGFIAGRFSGMALEHRATGSTKTLTSVATRVVGFAYAFAGTSLLADTICQYKDSGSAQVDLRTTTAGALEVTRNGTVLGTSSPGVVVGSGVWQYVEFQVTIGASGSFDVHVNGVSVLSASGVNTKNTANATCNQIVLQQVVGGVSNAWFDDFYCLNTSGSLNNTFLGESRILNDMPTGDGTHTAWTQSTGANRWSCVDEIPENGDTDYVSDATVGDIETFTFNSESPTGTIAAIQTTIVTRKDDSNARTVCEICRSGGTDYAGSVTFTELSTYAAFTQIRETDPNTGSAWTTAGVNAAELGVKVLS